MWVDFGIFYLICSTFPPIFLIFQCSFSFSPSQIEHIEQPNSQQQQQTIRETRGKCGSFKNFKTSPFAGALRATWTEILPVCCRNILLSKFMHSVLGIQCSVLLCCDVRTSWINKLEIYSWNLLLCALCSLVWESFLLNLLYIIMEISHKTLLLL